MERQKTAKPDTTEMTDRLKSMRTGNLNQTQHHQPAKRTVTTNPIKFMGTVGAKDKLKDEIQQDDSIVSEDLSKMSRITTHEEYRKTKLPAIPKSHVGRQAIKKIERSLEQYVPRDEGRCR